MSNICIYINTTIRTFNCTIYKNTIIIIFELSTWIYYNTTTAICIVTFNITINWYSISCTIYSSRLLINTIWRRILIISIINITDIWIYINSTIGTIHFTTYINTILTIFKWNTWIYYNTITIITFNNTINSYSNHLTIYSTRFILNKACLLSLNSSRILINTVFSICITNVSSY